MFLRHVIQMLVARAFGLKLAKILWQNCKTQLCEPDFTKKAHISIEGFLIFSRTEQSEDKSYFF